MSQESYFSEMIEFVLAGKNPLGFDHRIAPGKQLEFKFIRSGRRTS
jgi:hypothetical protein